MESSSRASSVDRTSHQVANPVANPVANRVANNLEGQLANLIGTIIALLTLTVPLFAIAHFSSADSANWQPGLTPDTRAD
ncbi:MAG: hypothetical protein ACKO7W_05165 [Elainella sp.]